VSIAGSAPAELARTRAIAAPRPSVTPRSSRSGSDAGDGACEAAWTLLTPGAPASLRREDPLAHPLEITILERLLEGVDRLLDALERAAVRGPEFFLAAGR
jgi:hypothetical protein